MTVADLAIIAGLVFAWGTLSARLERFDMTAPIVFTVAGVLLTHGPLAPLGITPGSEVVKVLAEATLALVLFSDASRVGLHQLRADLGLYLRLLGIGLSLAIGLGTLLAFILPGVSDIWLALLIGAALAPTDAALGAGMMVNPAVPAPPRLGGGGIRRRRGAGPGVLLLCHLGGAARQRVHRRVHRRPGLRRRGRPGGQAGALRRRDRHHAVAAGLADIRGGRGGPGPERPDLADGTVRGTQPDRDPDAAGSGRAGRGPAGRPAVLFIGWFGPRGLASVVFGVLALEDLAEAAARPAVTVIAFTVLLSVLAHGLSAGPLASRYGPRLTPPPGAAVPAGLAEIPARPLIRRSPAAGRPGEEGNR